MIYIFLCIFKDRNGGVFQNYVYEIRDLITSV